jgi:hypothetical protein
VLKSPLNAFESRLWPSIPRFNGMVMRGWRDHIGMNPNALALRIALPNLRWFLAVQPVLLDGNMRPIEDTKLDNKDQF